ncbi:MAG: hypothetical protein WDZ42_01325 [Candidatus Saccharimonadales bacterium]
MNNRISEQLSQPDTISELRERVGEGVSFKSIAKPNTDPGDPLFEEYDDVRVEWVQNVYNWLPPFHSDIDRLDIDDVTQIIGVTKEQDDQEVLLSAMRLTPIQDLGESLTWDMIKIISSGEEDKIKEKLMSNDGFRQALSEGRVYDVTRAFPNHEYPDYAEKSILQLFGASIAYCDMAQEGYCAPQDYYWLFTPNRPLKLFLSRHDIPFSEVSGDNKSDRRNQTSVMVVHVKEAYDHLTQVAPDHPSHKIIVDATELARRQLIV